MLLTDVKLMMVKVRMISVAQVRAVRILRRRRLLTPRKKEAVKAFHREISPVACGSCPVLKPVHFCFEPQKNDQRHHEGQADDEKGQDHDKRTVRQLKGRVDLVDDRNHQNQNDAEGNDPLVDVGIMRTGAAPCRRQTEQTRRYRTGPRKARLSASARHRHRPGWQAPRKPMTASMNWSYFLSASACSAVFSADCPSC